MHSPVPLTSSDYGVHVLAEYVSDHLSVFVVAQNANTRHPANGGLRLLNYPTDRACIADGRRLAALMSLKHGLYSTGFAGGKIVARSNNPDAVKEKLIYVTAALLQSLKGTMVTGCDLNTSTEDMEYLTALTPHVLAAVGSPVDASSATAYGALGAVEAVLDENLDTADPGRALVHGCGAVGSTIAQTLADHGWTVFTIDLDKRRAVIRGATALPVDCPWWKLDLDLFLPCSISGLINAEINSVLQVKAVIPAANAPFSRPELADELRWRNVLVLPDPLVNAGAVIADSIEHFSPEVWSQTSADSVYAFVRSEVRQRTHHYLRQCEQGMTATQALNGVAADSTDQPIGLNFANDT